MKKIQVRCGRALIWLLVFLVGVPGLVVGGECGEEAEEVGDKSLAKKYKVAAIVSILFSSAMGVSIPMLGKTFSALQPEKDLFFIVKSFAAGVILSTGFIHVLPDAFDKLKSPCLASDFPFAGLVAMLSAIGTLIIDSLSTSFFKNSHQHQNHDLHASSKDLLRHRVISQVLELGIVVHSVIIGISLGASESPERIRPLIAALTFHQFFEGMGLGGCISQARFKTRSAIIMALFFSMTTPVGIAMGMWITKAYKNSRNAPIVQGILNAASAGILIYMSLVDLLAADFMNTRIQESCRLKILLIVSLLLGAALMSLLAIWA